MMKASPTNRRGLALIITMIVMSILISLAYVTASKIISRQRRHNYLLNYYKANYACDSASRYAENQFKNSVDLSLKSREYMPDFSDLFLIDYATYKEMLAEFAEAIDLRKQERYEYFHDTGSFTIETEDDQLPLLIDDIINQMLGISDGNSNSSNDDSDDLVAYNQAITDQLLSPITSEQVEALIIPGPYGQKWPNIVEPIEMELGEAKISITIEDENSKYPIVWALENDPKTTRESEASLEIFTEWLGLTDEKADNFFEATEKAKKLKPFKIGMDTGYVTKQEEFKTRSVVKDKDGKRKSVFQTRTRTRKVSRGEESLYMDYMYLFNATFDVQGLSRDYYEDEYRKENIAMYMGLWGTQQVNINTAPRHVLEALFVYGGNEVDIAEEVIKQRQLQPFKSFDNLRERLYSYSGSLDEVKDRILCRSICWSIHVEASCGNAVARSTTAIMRTNKTYVKIATVYH